MRSSQTRDILVPYCLLCILTGLGSHLRLKDDGCTEALSEVATRTHSENDDTIHVPAILPRKRIFTQDSAGLVWASIIELLNRDSKLNRQQVRFFPSRHISLGIVNAVEFGRHHFSKQVHRISSSPANKNYPASAPHFKKAGPTSGRDQLLAFFAVQTTGR